MWKLTATNLPAALVLVSFHSGRNDSFLLKAALLLLGQGSGARWGKHIIVADARRQQPWQKILSTFDA